MPSFIPAYLRLYKTGELFTRIEALQKILEDCCLCPQNCRVNRLKGEKGVCRVGHLPMVSSYHAHFGEERPLVGHHGSGTIFLAFCNLKCLFCQNYDISHQGEGKEVSYEEMGSMMVSLMRQGCHNINFVTPSHQVSQIIASLPYAIEQGLEIPLVYNCGGYESVETIRLLDGIFDIYMPDFKYFDNAIAKKLSAASDYVERAKESIKEMHHEVGDLVIDTQGIAQRGLLVRHLVLPNGLAGTQGVMRFIAREISKNTYVNIMDQYRPCYKASEQLSMNRRITRDEYDEAIRITREEGIERIDGFF